MRWAPTHVIRRADGRRMQVMLCDDGGRCGPAYTWKEWFAYGLADYERTPDGWTFKGQPFEGEVEEVRR